MLNKVCVVALCLMAATAVRAEAQVTDTRSPVAEQKVAIAGTPRVFTGLSFTRVYGGPPVVVGVAPESPASQAGLAVGDTIVAVDGRDTQEGRLFPGADPGKRFTLTVHGVDGRERITDLVIAPPRTTRSQ